MQSINQMLDGVFTARFQHIEGLIHQTVVLNQLKQKALVNQIFFFLTIFNNLICGLIRIEAQFQQNGI